MSISLISTLALSICLNPGPTKPLVITKYINSLTQYAAKPINLIARIKLPISCFVLVREHKNIAIF